MTIYGTPMGTPLNTTPFQGTAPGNPVQVVLQTANPGVGLFPPGANNLSGDSVMAAVSRGALPINAVSTNFGQSGVSGGGRAISSSMSNAGTRGAGPGFTINGGGAQSVAPAPSVGSVTTIPASAPATLPTFAANLNFRG